MTRDPLRDQLARALGDRYVLESELAGGGMSRVFVARETALDRRVVVKVLSPELSAGVNRERFRNEIQLAARLQHPHIVPLFAGGEVDGIPYYTMPFIEGASLAATIRRRGALPVREVQRLLTDVAEALAYAHAQGVVHRDIKPANILLQGSHALVTDFGVAKALSAAMPATVATATGMVVGTPAYMAPEQLAGDPGADHRMDLYALGLVAYEALTGTAPYAAPSPQETMAAQLTSMPDPPVSLRAEVPRPLSDLVMRCLQKKADLRPANAEAVLAELERVPLASGEATTVRLPRPAAGGRRTFPTWALALVPLLLVAVALLVLRGREAPAAAPGAAAPDSPPSAARPETVARALSPQDSLAIARALTAGVAAADRRALDSIARQIQRELGDSLRQEMDSLRRAAERDRVPFVPPSPAESLARLDRALRRANEALRRGLVDSMSAARVGSVPASPATPSAPASPGEAVVVLVPFLNGTGDRTMSAPLRALQAHLKEAIDAHPGLAAQAARRPVEPGAGGGTAPRVVISGRLVARADSLVLQVRVVPIGAPGSPEILEVGEPRAPGREWPQEATVQRIVDASARVAGVAAGTSPP